MNLILTLNEITESISALHQEMLLVAGGFLLLILSFFKLPSAVYKGVFILTTLITAFWHAQPTLAFGGIWVITEHIIILARIILIFSGLLVFFPLNKNQRGSYYFLLVMMLLAALLLMKSRHFLLTYMAIEFLSYGAYLITAFAFTRFATEAAMKYLVFGGVSSALMLFGISWWYGLHGSLMITDISVNTSPLVWVSGLLILIGFLFKSSVVPVHIWLPDTYESGPADAISFLSVVPKSAALIALVPVVSALSIPGEWLLVTAILTFVLGALGALRQLNVRRIIAYGTLVHTGFLLALIIGGALSTFIWYMMAYALMNLGIFYVIAIMEDRKHYALADYRGLGAERPYWLFIWVVILLAQVGLPPTAGFTAKWLAFAAFYGLYNQSGSSLWLIIWLGAILVTAVSLYYYIRIAYVMIFAPRDPLHTCQIPRSHYVFAFILAFCLLALFFQPLHLGF
jgi:NADH-quinone oxidoreductase subunit N